MKTRSTGGIRRLQDLIDRCIIDDETGCWRWRCAYRPSSRGSKTPVVHIPAGVLGNAERVQMSAQKASWLLSGRTLRDGALVWRQTCNSDECINPEHCRSGSRRQMVKAVAATGRNRGDPVRAVINARNRASMNVPADVVRQVEEMFRAGALQKEVRSVFGIAADTARSIRAGLHPHCSASQRVIRGASVFSLVGRRA